MASTVLPNGIIIPEKYSRDWYNDLYHNWQELDNLLAGGGAGGGANDGTLTIQKNGATVGTFSANQATDETVNITVPDVNNGTLTIQKNGTDIGTFSANQATDETINITVPDVNNGTLTIQQNGTTVDTFTANSSSDKTVNIQCVDLTSNQTVGGIKTFSNAPVVGSIDLDGKSIDTDANGNMTFDGKQVITDCSIPFHNAYPRCKYLGSSITDAQNTAIKNRTYDDLFIGDYWTINSVNWRIVAVDYYYNVGDTNFDKGNLIVMPDTVLYDAQMNETNTTAGAYAGSLMRTQNLNSARTIAQNAFGSHLANHRILLANSVDASGPNNWAWYDSDGIELPNEVQIYGTRVWGSGLKGWNVATQKQQFPLMALAPQFVNIRQHYWLQDVSSDSVSSYFACIYSDGVANASLASLSRGVRPSVTLSYI